MLPFYIGARVNVPGGSGILTYLEKSGEQLLFGVDVDSVVEGTDLESEHQMLQCPEYFFKFFGQAEVMPVYKQISEITLAEARELLTTVVFGPLKTTRVPMEDLLLVKTQEGLVSIHVQLTPDVASLVFQGIFGRTHKHSSIQDSASVVVTILPKSLRILVSVKVSAEVEIDIPVNLFKAHSWFFAKGFTVSR